MNRRKPANIAHSVHQRLLAQARRIGRPFNELLQHYAIERFLYRLGRSPHAEKLLLKGALLLRVWDIPMARPTMDIDMLGPTTGSPEILVPIIRECMAIQVENDGIQFDPESITTEAITLDDDHQGWRVRFRGALGNARVTLQVDIGIGDVVTPSPIWIEYPVLLDQPAPRLMAYTPETAIAEKYQAMVELDKANTRMKDFHDIGTLARHLSFQGSTLSIAIQRTFERRKTPLPDTIPTALTAEFYDDKQKQTQWRAFINKGLLSEQMMELADVAKLLRDFLMPPTEALNRGEAFEMAWQDGGPWRRCGKGSGAC